VLDSFALLAYLQDEPGAQMVQSILANPGNEIMLCTINLGEVYYITQREKGEGEAEKALLVMEQLPMVEVTPDKTLVLQAARIKASFSISYADAFVAALAERTQSTVVTGDPEFEKLGGLSIQWISKGEV